MYAVGTDVLYGRVGVCRVESIGVPSFQKNSERSYYKLCAMFSSSGETIYVPVDAAGSIRPLVSSEEAEDSFRQLSRLRPQVCYTRQRGELAAHYQRMLASCGLRDCLLLLKAIFLKEKELEARGKRLGQVDIRYLKLAERLVCEEFAAVRHTTPDCMREYVYAAMDSKAAAT